MLLCVCVCVCVCVLACVCLHDRRCGDNLVNTHQRCGYILNCGDFTWVPRIKMLDCVCVCVYVKFFRKKKIKKSKITPDNLIHYTTVYLLPISMTSIIRHNRFVEGFVLTVEKEL